jgi:hypothetical protein
VEIPSQTLTLSSLTYFLGISLNSETGQMGQQTEQEELTNFLFFCFGRLGCRFVFLQKGMNPQQFGYAPGL